MVQTNFHALLCTYFNKSELQALCFDLNINYENLPGSTLSDKARELITFCHRYNQLQQLINRCLVLRPIVSWPDAQTLQGSLNNYFPPPTQEQQNLRNSPPVNQTIQGNYNAVSGPGGNSTVNVTNIHHSVEDNADTVLERGIQLLNTKTYTSACDSINKALKLEPNNPKIHFYLALAMLNGSRPKLLKMSTIKSIEKHLQIAIELSPQFGQAYILWALIKYDYYVMNSMFERPPTVSQLLQRKWSINRGEINELKAHLKAPRNKVWEWLQSL